MLSENSLTIIPETMAGLKLLKGKNLLQGYLRNEGTVFCHLMALCHLNITKVN